MRRIRLLLSLPFSLFGVAISVVAVFCIAIGDAIEGSENGTIRSHTD